MCCWSMNVTANISGNVQIDVMRRLVDGSWSVERHHVKNLITTVGLTAWAYNLVNSDGQVIDRIAVGSNSTAPALGDTALGTQLAIYTGIRSVVVGDTAVITYWIVGAERDSRASETIKEIALFTKDTGATPSSNKMIARAVVPDIDIDSNKDTVIVVVWNLTVGHADSITTGQETRFTDYGKKFIAGRVVDMTLEAVLDKVAFGTTTTIINPREVEKLTTETLRETPSTAWSATAGVVSCIGSLASGAGAGVVKEMGAAVGVTASVKTLYQAIHNLSISCDNNVNTCAYDASITLANV